MPSAPPTSRKNGPVGGGPREPFFKPGPRPHRRAMSGAFLLVFGLLAVAAWRVRQVAPDERRPRFTRPPGQAATDPKRAGAGARAGPSTGATLPDVRSAPWREGNPVQMAGLFPVEEGFREAKDTSWDQSLRGYVESVDGTPGGRLVIVEWVAAIRPNPAQRSGLKQIGARRDPNGIWWARKSTVTDESGLFSLDGLPDVQLRVRAAGEVRNSRPGSFVSFRAGNP